jgi:hypothetical protein
MKSFFDQYPELQLEITDPNSAVAIEKYESQLNEETLCWYCMKRPFEERFSKRLKLQKKFRVQGTAWGVKEFKVFSFELIVPRCSTCYDNIPKLSRRSYITIIGTIIVGGVVYFGAALLFMSLLFPILSSINPLIATIIIMLLSLIPGIPASIYVNKKLKAGEEASVEKLGIIRYEMDSHIKYPLLKQFERLGWDYIQGEKW